jgi:hypothetical protein
MPEPLHPDAITLLAQMIEADEVASLDGLADAPFRVLLANNQVTYLDHPGLQPNRPLISRRAILGLRSAGLLQVQSETSTALIAYLAPDAQSRLDEARQDRLVVRPAMSGWRSLRGREFVERLIADGWTVDEVVDGLHEQVFELDGDLFYLAAPPGKRRLKARIAELIGLEPELVVPREIAVAYSACGARPTQLAVAMHMGFDTEQPLRDRLRKVGIDDWRKVHRLMGIG